MNEQEWIGIQFNLDKDMGLKKWLEKYMSSGIKTDGEHITVSFGRNELKRIGTEDSRKIGLIKSAIKMCLKRSDYTNIYTYLDAEELHSQKPKLLNEEFNEPIRITEFKESKSILANYDTKLESGQVKKILRKSKLMIAMDEIFNFVVDRDFEKEQLLTLDLRYEDKEEWGADRDNLNVSIQLEKLEE
jgi:hypothetical protein